MTLPKACAGAALLFSAALASAAVAQPTAEGRAALAQKLADCRTVSSDAARLACYDAAAAALDRAEASGDIVIVDREGAKRVRRQAFGFSFPALSIFDRASEGGDGAALDRITATLDRAYQRGDGKWVLELEDGAVWVQTDSEPLRGSPDKGASVEIRRAAISGYFINVAKQRAIRATRLK